MSNLRFNVGPNTKVEFDTTDGTLDITLSEPHGFIYIALNAVHARALLRCLPAMIQAIEASERISGDVGRINDDEVFTYANNEDIKYTP